MNDFEEKYNGKNLAQVAASFKSLREKHADLKEQAADIWKEVDYLRMTAIPELMEEMGIDTVKLTDIGRISLQTQASCSTLDKNKLMDWLREHDSEDIISDTINSSTLKSFVMHRIADGEEIPPDDIIKFKPFQVATITKG